MEAIEQSPAESSCEETGTELRNFLKIKVIGWNEYS